MDMYKERMIKEYTELKEKYGKIHRMIVKHDAGKVDLVLDCPIALLKNQKAAMGQYLYCLEVRAELAGVDLERGVSINEDIH